MRKNKILSILVVSVLIIYAQPAHALIIDPSAIAQVITKYTKIIQDVTKNITQKANQIKQYTAQGFGKDELFGVAKEYATNYGKQFLDKKLEKTVEGTKEKNSKVLKSEMELYVNNRKVFFDEKITITQKNKSETEGKRAAKIGEVISLTNEINVLKQTYESVKNDSNKEPDAFMKLQKAIAALDAAKKAASELDTHGLTLDGYLDQLKEQRNKVGTDNDVQYKIYKDRLEQLKKTEEDETFVVKLKEGGVDEWDDPRVAKEFSPNEQDYKKFLTRYFYNPEEAGSELLNHQTKIDSVMRERRYLLTNTAAHLLQVTATLRREVPARAEIMQKIYSQVPGATAELDTISGYGSTRIENAKVLLMYAKLQSAKLQYRAASELMTLDGKKIPNPDFSIKDFDLGKYVLTSEIVDKVAKKLKETNSSLDAIFSGKTK